jgi:hypothetical protein
MKNTRSLPILFLGLYLTVPAGAQTGVTLLVRTDMDCYWKLDGQPMGLLKADDSKVVPASSGEHLIQANSAGGVATIRDIVKVDEGQKIVNIQLKSRHDELLKLQFAETVKKQAETVAAWHPVWTDPDNGLMWSQKDNGSDVNWNQANDYCAKLELAGYNDWRLPTIEELQGIYDPSVSVERVFEMGTFKVHVKGNLKLSGWDWSSSQGESPGKPWQMAWLLSFTENEPLAFPLDFNYSTRALCVRHSGD